MEHEKKKRQKKKKNKQGKANERPPSGSGELNSENNNHANVNNQNLNSENADVHNKGLQQRVVDSDRESISGTETSQSVEAESYSLNREASLQQKIKELQEQLEVHVLREADLERNISQSHKEINLWRHKETEFETRMLQLQTEKDIWLQKEAGYQEKVYRYVEETNTLNKDNARLQAQVMEVEASINDISHQNQQLKEHVSVLQSKIQNLENSVATHLFSEKTKHVMEDEEMKTQLESARALIVKLVSENETLIEKVNSLNAELDQKSVTTNSSFSNKPDDPMVTNSEIDGIDETSATETDPMPPSSSTEKVSDKVMEPMKDEVIRFKSNNSTNDLNRVSMESGEIVQIPLDENDVLIVPKSTKAGGGDAVPLTDAPLIGAPFRFISLVAQYVSGADLVDKS